MACLNDSRLLNEQISDGKIYRLTATLDANAEYVVVHEVSVKNELDSFRTAERSTLPKHVTQLSAGLIAFAIVGLV